jgi:cysteine-rich repeat protein
MSKRLWFLALFAVLACSAPVWLSGAAQAGPPFVCGDGEITPPETCDDSNTVTGDGCSHPSCKDEVCGDDIINPDPPGAEECDGGNNTPGDGCDANCKLECPNGTTDPGEDCDDDGESATCDDDCTNVDCGDNNVNETSGEACDDGNTVDGDTCSADCLTITDTEALPKEAQACVNAINKNLAGVAKAQTADIASCIKSVSGGKTPAIGDCYGDDLKGKVQKAQDKTTATFTGKKCTPPKLPAPPDFAFTTATAVNDAGEVQPLEGTTLVLGDPQVIILKSANKEGAACQGEVVKQYNALLNKYLSEANKLKKTALKGGKGGTPPPADSPAALATVLDGLPTNANVTKQAGKVTSGITKKCTDALVAADGFDCGAATTVAGLSTCVITLAEQAACEALEAADGLTLACPALVP